MLGLQHLASFSPKGINNNTNKVRFKSVSGIARSRGSTSRPTPLLSRALQGDENGEWQYEEECIGVVDFSDPFIVQQTQRLLNSFKRTFDRPMLPEMPPALSAEEQARYLFLAEAAVMSHNRVQLANGLNDNMFNYANRTALKAFERTFQEQTSLPSSSAAANEDDTQSARNKLLGDALLHGHEKFTTDRVSTSGKTIHIEDGLLFNVVDERDIYAGQAVLLESVTVQE